MLKQSSEVYFVNFVMRKNHAQICDKMIAKAIIYAKKHGSKYVKVRGAKRTVLKEKERRCRL